MITEPPPLLLTHIQIDASVAAVRVGVQSGHAVRWQQIRQPNAQAGKEAQQALQAEEERDLDVTRKHRYRQITLPAQLCRDCANRVPIVYRARHAGDPPACRVWST